MGEFNARLREIAYIELRRSDHFHSPETQAAIADDDASQRRRWSGFPT